MVSLFALHFSIPRTNIEAFFFSPWVLIPFFDVADVTKRVYLAAFVFAQAWDSILEQICASIGYKMFLTDWLSDG